jgi:hydroxymethylpyrimidine/phosphomethylpyrimidine kinase
MAAAITARLACGDSVPGAVAFGKRFIVASVRHSYPLGAGHGPVSPLWRITTDPV